MEKTTQNIKRKQRIHIASILGLSIIITFMFAGFSSNWQAVLLNIIYGAMIGLSIAFGCGFISKQMLSKGDWMRSPIKKYISVIVVVAIFIIVDVLLINILWFKLTQDRSIIELFYNNYYLWILIAEFTIGLIIYLIVLSARFAENLNEFYTEAEETKNEINKFKYNALKNQVNPHFLFNSLNALSSLLYKDTSMADEFIAKLSGIYRYVLEVENKEVVRIEDEIKFIEDFLYLHTIRFSNMLKYNIDIIANKDYVVPMAIQIIVENAIKHNEIKTDKPLIISIKQDGDKLLISNNKTKKVISNANNGIGLENIIRQYQFLTDQQVKIIDSKDYFEVSLPILKTINRYG